LTATVISAARSINDAPFDLRVASARIDRTVVAVGSIDLRVAYARIARAAVGLGSVGASVGASEGEARHTLAARERQDERDSRSSPPSTAQNVPHAATAPPSRHATGVTPAFGEDDGLDVASR
jgi:hypothetical protein